MAVKAGYMYFYRKPSCNYIIQIYITYTIDMAFKLITIGV